MRKTGFTIAALLVTVFLGASCAKAPAAPDNSATVTLQNGVNGYNGTQTVTIDSTAASTNFGSTLFMYVQTTTDPYYAYGFVKFDLSYLLPGTVIDSAAITLYISYLNGPMSVDIWRVGAPWNQFTSTYSNTVFGGETLIATDALSGSALTIQLPKQMVQEWVNNPAVNDGIYLSKSGAFGTYSVDFYMAGVSFTTPSLAPKIQIKYEK